MFTKSGFSQQQQFHLLINFIDGERSITILPNHKGEFLIIDQGMVLGKLGFDKYFNFISKICKITADVIFQLADAIKIHHI